VRDSIERWFGIPSNSMRFVLDDCPIVTLPQRAVDRDEAVFSILSELPVRHLCVLDAFGGVGCDCFAWLKVLRRFDCARTGTVYVVQTEADGRFERLEHNVRVFLDAHGSACVEVKLFCLDIQTFLARFADGVSGGFDFIYADPPWPTPSGGIDFSRNRGSAARPSLTTIAYIDFLKQTLFDPLLSSVAGAVPARLICLKAPASFSEMGPMLFESCVYLQRGYVFCKELRMRNRRGCVVGYFHFLKFAGEVCIGLRG
jgi:hypothetical protein